MSTATQSRSEPPPPVTSDDLDLLLSLSDSELEAWLSMVPPLNWPELIQAMAEHKASQPAAASPAEVSAASNPQPPDLSTPATLAATVSRGRWSMARHLQHLDRVLMDSIRGRSCKRIIVTMPPRHGKSEHCSNWLPAWYIGTYPDKRVILASYEASFAEWWGGKARGTLEEFGGLFGARVRQDSRAKSHWELYGHAGGMQTAGVGGPITGKGADLLIVDDPIKNAEEAASETRRRAIWDWWQSTAYTRLEPDGMALVIQTRWHEDDLAGRLIADAQQGGEEWIVVNLPAVAEEGDALGRLAGEALWPERYNRQRLDQIKTAVGSRVWASLYQQRPTALDGEFFKREWFGKPVAELPADAKRAVRAWDKAGTEGGGDYSAGVLVAEHAGIYYIADVLRGQWSSHQRNRVMEQTAAIDADRFDKLDIWTEQEPGSGGKESAEFTVRMLAGYSVHSERVTGDKPTRASAFAAQCEAGYVRLVAGPWNKAYLDELCSFPNASHDDQVDASSLAFNKLARPRKTVLVG